MTARDTLPNNPYHARMRGPALAGILLLGLLLIGLGAMIDPRGSAQRPASQARPASVAAPVVGAPAPDFALQTADGQTIRLHALRGQVVLVNFWATWCGPCRAEMPTMQAMYDAYQAQGLTVLGVNMREQAPPVQDFLAAYELSFPVVLDADGAVARTYQVVHIPTSYFIDRDGIVRARYFGPMSHAVIEAGIEGMLP